MNIKQAYASMTIKEFVDWALENNYPYCIATSNVREHGIIWPKKGDKKYKFDYNPQNYK
jgi:hypothetical protein